MSLEERLEALEDDNRRLHAIASAQEFALEILLTNFMVGLSPEDRDGFAAEIIRVGSNTEHLTAPNDTAAEILADIAVQSHERLAALISKARSRAE